MSAADAWQGQYDNVCQLLVESWYIARRIEQGFQPEILLLFTIFKQVDL